MRSVSFRDNFVQCPRCGQMVPLIANGVYSFDSEGNATLKGTTDLLQAGNYNPDELRRLLALTWQAQRSQSLREEFTTQANEIAPGLGDRLEAYFKSRQYTLVVLGLLLTATLGILGLTNQGGTMNNTTIINRVPEASAPVKIEPSTLQQSPPKPSSEHTPPKPRRGRKK